ncbi:glycogen debranching N-terminal domain-containing protein [Methyloceanibacter sp.]|jgi:glycogen debranching enzyme|uniref:amylo-alpha-1,6-glucosidase n=1 Tax=Methyloceanibacter sp. TaxID=1965321 RepID=UPI00351AF3A3
MVVTAAERALEVSERAAVARDALHVLKHDDLFAVFDAYGDFHGELHPVGPSEGADGLFQDDTRILSKLSLRIHGQSPELLSGSVGRDNVVFTAHLTNAVFRDRHGILVPEKELYIVRRRLLWRCKLYEALQIQSFAAEPVALDLTFEADADFRDVFELRGMTRIRRGESLKPCVDADCFTLSYRGLDGETRVTALAFSAPAQIRDRRIILPVEVEPSASQHILMTIASDGDTSRPSRTALLAALKGAKREARRHIKALDRIATSNAAFDRWIDRASADLALLITELETGPYPYAGIPWFSVPFGRDALVTALQVLWINPALARGVLAYLSAAQAAERSSFHDAEPGKILHETRKGEMARLREVPFGRYYGGVDATPLFVMLAGAYLKRTNDVAFCAELWPAIREALNWIEAFGDADGDGFVEYLRAEAGGLQNQGWKDSDSSIFHEDGSWAKGAIAVVEMQAYVVAGWRAAAEIASVLEDTETSSRLLQKADALQQAINRRFWCEELGTYALALDGDKRRCEISTSNAGHVLFCGVADEEKAKAVRRNLMDPRIFSGWGIRTVATDASLYNPMSYHNGSIWPHDCSIAASGLSRYGMNDAAGRIFTALFDAACRFPDFRLPELFCGFPRHASEAPVSYPSACTPQAWASGAVFLMLQASLGIEVEARTGTILVANPYLPDWLDRVTVNELPVGNGRATLHFRRRRDGVEVGMTAIEGPLHLTRLADKRSRRGF